MLSQRRGSQFLGILELSRWGPAVYSGRNFRIQFQNKGARPWQLQRRDGLALCIHDRAQAGSPSSDDAILNEVQFCSNTMLREVGSSAFQRAFGTGPVDLDSWRDIAIGLQLVQKVSASGQLVKQRQPR